MLLFAFVILSACVMILGFTGRRDMPCEAVIAVLCDGDCEGLERQIAFYRNDERAEYGRRIILLCPTRDKCGEAQRIADKYDDVLLMPADISAELMFKGRACDERKVRDTRGRGGQGLL